MKIAVIGLWHLGSVITACLAEKGHSIVAYDDKPEVVSHLKKGIPPITEPELTETLHKCKNNIIFTDRKEDAAGCDLFWIAIDTPVDADDNADVEHVMKMTRSFFPLMKEGSIVLLSSQLPVGSTKKLEEEAKKEHIKVHFACSPENLRLGKAIPYFRSPDRIVVGVRDDETKKRLTALLSPFTENLLFMRVESAEMTKHAINAFLATSVVFANALATLCEQTGADGFEVEQGLKSEARIGQKAYVKPGGAFAGGTLARDLQFLIKECKEKKVDGQLFSAVLAQNEAHKLWSEKRLTGLLGSVNGRRIAILGLTYKPGTDTLRRSSSIEIADQLLAKGAEVIAFDPAIKEMPPEYARIKLGKSVQDALTDADACIIATPWPKFQTLAPADFSAMRRRLVLDPAGFLKQLTGTDIEYYVVGHGNI
jgi:UDPglucose 6-dehydrogenase